MKRIISCIILALPMVLLLRSSDISHAEEAVTPRVVVTKTLPLLQTLGTKFIEQSGCVSCHNNALPAMAVAIARERGFKIDEQAVQTENAKIAELWGAKREGYLQGSGAPGGNDTASYILLGMAANKLPANAMTDAVVHYVAGQQTPAGNWEILTRSRPPLEASHFNATALSLRGLQLYAPKGRSEAVKQQIAKARQWLTQAAANKRRQRVSPLRPALERRRQSGETKIRRKLARATTQRWRLGAVGNDAKRCLCDGPIARRAASRRRNADQRPGVSTRRAISAQDVETRRLVVCAKPFVSFPETIRERLSLWQRSMDFGSGDELGGDGAGFDGSASGQRRNAQCLVKQAWCWPDKGKAQRLF